MVCFKSWPVIWMRGVMVASVGFGSMVLAPSISLAQYPGSAGDLGSGAIGASSSASSGSSSASASSSSGMSTDWSADGSASDSMAGSGYSADGSDDNDGYEGITAVPLSPKKAVRKRALIRQFRREFAKIMTIETANKSPLRALSADAYLDQFSKELDTGLDQQADVDSLGHDLGLVRDALDDRLDEVIASYDGDAPWRGFFSKTASSGKSVPLLRAEIQKLKLKHELLVFGEYSLQAMGYYTK